MIRFIFSFCLCIAAVSLSAQESRLANQYYQEGEYEKAASLYEKLYKKTRGNDYYYSRYIESLMAVEEYDKCEKSLKTEIKKRPKDVQLYVTYGNLFERTGQADKAEDQYKKAIRELSKDRNTIYNLGNAFIRLTKYDWALQAFEKGEALNDKEGLFANSLADIYRRKGDVPNMIKYNLLSAIDDPSRFASIKNFFIRNLASEDYVELKKQLYTRIQEDPDNIYLPELLEWVFIQDQDYEKALRQAKALDKRLEENGTRVYSLGSIATNAKEYDTAIKAFSYIVSEKGKNSTYYFDAKQAILNCKKRKVLQANDLTQEGLLDLRAEYESFLGEIGRNKQSAYIVSEYANLEAYYLNDLDKAIALLKEMIEYPGVNRFVKANGKISLADFYLMNNEIWESTLLYSQVDKEFREDFLGEKARFKNAKLSYYNGDFEWAQSQFKVLKSSTSKLISNDAIDLSVFIMDNMNLDTTDAPLKMYAQAELLGFQALYDDAFKKLDSIPQLYPDHSLLDDIYYAKAEIHLKKREYNEAIPYFERIIADHPEEIRCDNSIFQLASLYENQLGNLEKASSLYEKLFIDFSNSTYAIEARKRYRILRGDSIQ